MIILGITDSITSGAAVVIDGRIVAAVSEERLNRQKMSIGFPELSIREVMRIAGVGPADIDEVAVATSMLFWRPQATPYVDYFREERGGYRDTFMALSASASKFVGNIRPARQLYNRLKTRVTRVRRKAIPELLEQQFGIVAPIRFLDHHLCHAASAYFTAGRAEATVITMDGAGDGKCSRVYHVKNGKFRMLQHLDSYDSVGNYYAYVTHLCGFKGHRHEGKITGLAAYGEPEYLDLLRRFVRHDGKSIENIGRCFDKSAIRKLEKTLPANFSRENLSASVQVLLEESVSSYCDYWVGQSGAPHVALAGGVFANVKLNQRVHELPAVASLFVHPGMGDEGLAVGAALFRHAQLAGYDGPALIGDVFLGGEFSSREAVSAAKEAGLKPTELNEPLAHRVARLLADGKVVARCAGRMEYGPRALGNRTIMYQTTDPDVNTWLNDRLSRTEFMPFAPVTLWESRHDCYRAIDGAEETARFMTVTFDCLPTMRTQSPAVCHVDGTARPQLIREQDNPEYYAIVREYRQLTGIPSVVNTSFNIHEEPIVNTPAEAIKAFEQSRLDALVLGDELIMAPAAWSEETAFERRERPAARWSAKTAAS
jgi:carbamoyltransferase